MSFYLHDIYTILLICSAIFFTFLISRDKKSLTLLIKSVINQKYDLSYIKNNNFGINILIGMNTIILLTIVVSFWLPTQLMSFQLFIKLFIILLVFIILKTFIIYVLGGLFELLNYSKKYYQLISINLILISLIFYPIILFFSYFQGGELLINYSIYVFYAFCIIYSLFKILIIKRLNLLRFKFMFYNILYLCTIEVLPYIGLFKLLNNPH